MNTIKFDAKNTKVIAHRGLSGLERENTNAAFVAAGNRESYFGIETDIHVTNDGFFAIHHDNTLDRVFGKSINIEEANYVDINKVKGADKDNLTRSDLTIPTLDEYIRICKKYEKVAVLEIKNPMLPRQLDEVMAIIDTYNMCENTIIISFDWGNCEHIRKWVSKTQKVQFLCCEFNDELLAKLVENNIDLDIAHNAVTKEVVDKIHKNGLVINCWTVDDKERAEELAAMGVDFITSNILEAN